MESGSLDLGHLQLASRRIIGRYLLVTALRNLGCHRAWPESCRVSSAECMSLLCCAISNGIDLTGRSLTYDELFHHETQALSP